MEIVLENLHIAGPGEENYLKTLNCFRAVTALVVEEISEVEPITINAENGADRNIHLLEEKYQNIGKFILDRVYAQVGLRKYKPVYEVKELETAESA